MHQSLAAFMPMVVCLSLVVGCGATEGTSGAEGQPGETTSPLISIHGSGFYDGSPGPATQCNLQGINLHCCPKLTGNLPSVMMGARLDQNVFKCGQLLSFNPSDGSPQFLDYSTRRQNIRACPTGSVMTGFNQSLDVLLCQRMLKTNLVDRVDGPRSPTQDGFPMHVCEATYEVMGGIDSASNTFLCVR